MDVYPEQEGVVQYADVNQSLRLHIGSTPEATVFKSTIPCFTTNSVMVLRVFTKSEDGSQRRHWRVIRGEPLLRLIGFIGADPDNVSDEFLSRLAFASSPC